MSRSPVVIDVDTPVGLARAHVTGHRGRTVRGTVVLGHGAGGGVDAPDLAALAASLPGHGWQVVLVESPWRVAGRRVASPPPTLDTAWCAVVGHLRDEGLLAAGLLVVGGRSAGARVACRTARTLGADAVVALAFPLHPPGRPAADRGVEARGAGPRLLVVQGARDPFGSADEVRRAVPRARVIEIPAADHALAVPRSAPITRAEALDLVVGGVGAQLAEWARRTRR